MRDNYARLFQPPFLRAGVPNPRHLSTAACLALARAAAKRGARRNGLPSALFEESPGGRRRAARVAVSFPGGGFAPTRVAVAIRGGGQVRLAAGRRPDRIEVEARATAELIPDDDLGLSGLADGGGYDGPFAFRQGKPMRPDVALAFDRMAAAARREAGLFLSITSGYRSDAEQAVLWAANPDPKWVAPPGTSLHRYGTELDVGPALLSAQIYAESNFNPFAESPAGAQGIAQFMPGTAQSMGLEDPFDPQQAIDAQAHLMRDLLRRFGSVPLALAAYNAGAGAVEQYGGIPPFAETRAYVAKILGLLGGAGDLGGALTFEVRLVE